ncbi:MAG: hypothetical protein H6669_09395 [Ardenticatenaceae bacterium]|nr:hypothetical protein [Ardenticatenaceae bacterium]
MTTFNQFCAGVKMRHDYSNMIQVRYAHSNGETFDTWVSGEEVMQRLDTQSRARLIKSFSQKNWQEAKNAVRQEIEKGKEKARRSVKDRLADTISDQIGGNIFGDTFADNVRGVDSNVDAHNREKTTWQARLHDESFRAITLELAWINLDGTLPDEKDEKSLDDWV